MTVAQMLAHCSLSVQWAVGELVPEREALQALHDEIAALRIATHVT
jgi:hypothetical protein